MRASRPRLVPDTPPRAVLYLRQSTHREESISLELQETAGRDYCERMGYNVVEVEADPGISGRTWNRPAVKRVMAMVEDGSADVIVLWKWSRLSRSRRDWAVAVDRIDVAGGRIESATEPLDVQTSTGRLARGMMTEFAAFESERIGDVWREAHARRVKSGRPANGKPRWGYIYDDVEKLHKPDPEIGPIVAQVYARYLAGESIYALVRWLNASGYLTAPGYSPAGPGPWSDHSLRRVLDNGFAAGFFRAGGELHKGAHEPLISMEVWEEFKAARHARRGSGGGERSQYLLSGLMRCGRCGGAMSGGQFGGARKPKFRCVKGKEQGLHEGTYASMHLAEAAVMEWLKEQAADLEDESAAAVKARSAARRRRDDAQSLAREINALNEQLVRATRQHISGVIPAGAYTAVRDELEEQVRFLEERRLAASVEAKRAPGPELARNLLAEWELLSVEHRRGALKKLIRNVVVVPARPRGEYRVVPVWGEGESAP